MLMMRIGGLVIGAITGGIVGGSKMLCADGSCPLTGSAPGGAIVGAILGFCLLGVFAINRRSVEIPSREETLQDNDLEQNLSKPSQNDEK